MSKVVRSYQSVYFASDLNNPGETGPWKGQKAGKHGTANKTYKKNWRAFLVKNVEPEQKNAKPPKLFRITKDGKRIPVGD